MTFQLDKYMGLVGSLGLDEDGTGGGFKPGKPADHLHGVAFFTPWEEPFSGFPEHARRMAVALSEAGMPVQLRSTDPNAQWNAGKERQHIKDAVDKLTMTSIAMYAAQIFMIVPSRPAIMNLVTHPHYSADELRHVNSLKILSTVWERQNVSPEFAAGLSKFGQIWVPNHDNARMLVGSGVPADKVHVVRMPIDSGDPLFALRRRPRRPGPPRFYHIGKWEPRKAQDKLIAAFLLAFSPGEAMLFVKTSEASPRLQKYGVRDEEPRTLKSEPAWGDGGYPAGPFEALLGWLEDSEVKKKGWTRDNVSKSVLIRRQMMSLETIRQLHEVYDCYVSLSRGEAVDMPALDAKMAGNRLLYTPSGGPQDFASMDDVKVPVSSLVPAHPIYGWEKDSKYYNYTIAKAVEGYQRAAELVRSGERPRDAPLEEWMAPMVGERMRALTTDLAPILAKKDP